MGLNDSGEYRCGSDLTGEAVVRVNVVAAETEQELKSFHLDTDSATSRASRFRFLLSVSVSEAFCFILCLAFIFRAS